MNIFWSKLALVIITLVFLLRFIPLAREWRRRSKVDVLEHPIGFFQYLPHMAMVVHTALSICVLLSVNALPFLPATRLVRRLDSPGLLLISMAGLLYYIAANMLRWRAAKELRQSFEKEVIIKRGHQLITSGPYHFTRHPIYIGNILAEISIGLTLLYWPLVVFPLLISFPLWQARAKKEEQMLVHHYPITYRNYIGCVKRWGLF